MAPPGPASPALLTLQACACGNRSWVQEGAEQSAQEPGHTSRPPRARGLPVCDAAGPVCPLQREILPSTRLGTLPPAFSTRVLPAQATEYAFAFIQVPQDVSLHPFLPPKGDSPLTHDLCCGPSTYSRELNAKPSWVPPSTPSPALMVLRRYCGPGLGLLPLACWARGCSCLPMLLPASDGATRSDCPQTDLPGSHLCQKSSAGVALADGRGWRQ